MHSRRRVGKHVLCWHSTAKGTMPWQMCSASVKPAGIIQVFLEKSKGLQWLCAVLHSTKPLQPLHSPAPDWSHTSQQNKYN